uniref:Cf-2.2 n=1 Tax=Solanum tuberosum TaxID=4113 RepID=M1A3S4_SOLTU
MGYAVIMLLIIRQPLAFFTVESYYCPKPYPKTSSWNTSRDCCSWDGVVCDDITGHVIELDLSCSNLTGTIDSNSSLFQLSHLQRLDLSWNNFSNSHISPEFSKFSSLMHLDLSGSYFSGINHELNGNFPKTKWNSSASLIELDLRGVNFSDNLPESLGYHLTSLLYLSLESCNLRGPIPESLSNLTRIEYLHLNRNSLNGTIPPGMLSFPSLHRIDLSNNHLSGPFEDFKSNLLQGSLPILSNSTVLFFISHNNLTGEIPSSICNLTSLIMLDLATNNLRGEIPQCFGNITSLQVLDMRHNNLSGNIPTTFSNGSSLRSLYLHGNKLEGKIPQSLTNCKQLEVLDLGDNHLNDTFPVWLGTLPKLKVLSLRFNKLHGPIRTSRIENIFSELRIIDLSYNAFSGNLPSSLFQHLKAMRTADPSKEPSKYGGDSYYQDSIAFVFKGYEREVVRILFLYITIDLSNNKFEGHIPTIMGDLIALRVLNISHNGLEGPIPSSLGSLSLVESLDLSSNHLVGKIPAQFASLTSLEVFNLSYNHLEGCIPQGNQLHTFENNSYEGNDGLRGFPVTKSCGTTYAVSGQQDGEESNSEFLSDFRKAALMGYGSGLCIGISIVYFMMSTGKTGMVCKNHCKAGAQNNDEKEKEAAKAKELQKKK